MDVSSANNLHKPIVSSAMSLINNKKRRCIDIHIPVWISPWPLYNTPAYRAY
jgi:hypothetical protein